MWECDHKSRVWRDHRFDQLRPSKLHELLK
jgi:hypothetical protein